MTDSDEHLSGDELQRRLREDRADFERALAAIPVARWEEPLLDGGWSVKDTLGHLAHWQNDVIERLGWPAERLREPLDDAAIERTNAEARALSLALPLDQVRAAYEHAGADFAEAFAALDDATLNDAQRWAWTEGQSVWRWAAADGWDHCAEHADNIRAAARAAGLTDRA